MPVDIYVNSLDGSASIMSATIHGVETIVPVCDQTVYFYVPTAYMKNKFSFTTQDTAVGSACGEDTSRLLFNTKYDSRLHLNASKAYVPTVHVNEISSIKTLDNDYILNLAYQTLASYDSASLFQNVVELREDIYNKLETVWNTQKLKLTENTTHDFISALNADCVCKTIYKHLAAKVSSRFVNLVSATQNDVDTFQLPLETGDTLNYVITLKSGNSTINNTSVSDRTYLVKIVLTGETGKHVSGVAAQAGHLVVSGVTTSDYYHNIVGEYVLCHDAVGDGLNYTPTV